MTTYDDLEQATTDWGRKFDDDHGREISLFGDWAAFYTPEGKPCTWGRYAELMLPKYRGEPGPHRVALTELDDYTVSTVWVGHNMQMMWSQSAALIFETMVFDADGHSVDDPARYVTREQAVEGHARIVREVSARGDAAHPEG